MYSVCLVVLCAAILGMLDFASVVALNAGAPHCDSVRGGLLTS